VVGKLARAPRAQKPSPTILMRIWIDQLCANYIGIREVHVFTAVARAASPIEGPKQIESSNWTGDCSVMRGAGD